MTTTVRIEGGLLSPDLLERLHELEGQKPKDFGMDARGSFVDQVASVWTDAQTYWKAFERRRAHAAATEESVTTITREGWMIPFLEALGYQLTFQRRALEVDGRTFTISHRAAPLPPAPSPQERGGEEELPVHIVGYDLELGSRPPAGRGTLSPHGLMQDYLNRTEQVWGIVTNGFVLRLLRDSSYLTRPSYIEFDLKQMLEGGRLDEFILLYRLVQRTRLPNDVRDADQCWLEKYHQQAIEQGGRIREGLREAVEETIVTLANGFLAHPKNEALRAKIRDGKLDGREFYRQLLYIIYRLLFLFVAEERNLLVSAAPNANTNFDAARFYREQFSLTHLRALADEPLTAPERFDDLYLGLRTLFYALANEEIAVQLGLPVLNGELFATLDDLDNALLTNRDVLQAISKLAYFYPKDEKVRRRVNYAALDVEELGSVYESLLDYQPVLSQNGGMVQFRFAEGTERKSTGSYYTAPQLVNELIQSALMPVLRERLDAARTRDDKKRAILEMSVIDPAAGSGHFLLAAARAMGRELAKIETASDEPSPEATRLAIREVITHCIYGVDKNPRAMDLCKVALWLEGHSPEKPLTFLDHRIRNGDSLVGVRDLAVLQDGIPDEGFDPIAGDDRAVATMAKKQNRLEQKQRTLPFDAGEMESQYAAARKILSDTPDDTAQQIRKKREAYKEWQAQSERERRACDLWTAAFFVPLTRENWEDKRIPTTDVLRREMESGNVDRRYNATAKALSENPAHKFFHWALEYPDVFANGGFDVVLGNPPWERIKLQEQDFFGTRDAAIASAPNKAARQKLIDVLPKTNPALLKEFQDAKHAAEAASKFVRGSGRFPLTAVGDVNTYALFTEHARDLINGRGRVGIIVPTGIATDDTNKQFFGNIVQNQTLAHLLDFKNSEGIFPSVDANMRFTLLTLSGYPIELADFAFFVANTSELSNPKRRFSLPIDLIQLFNPNTQNSPSFWTRLDVDLSAKIYRAVPIVENQRTGANPWGISFSAMFHMSNDSKLFAREQTDGYLRLYESKMFHHFNHRFANAGEPKGEMRIRGSSEYLGLEELSNPKIFATSRYFVDEAEVNARIGENTRWLLAFRNVTGVVANERTVVCTLLPKVGAGNSAPVILPGTQDAKLVSCLLANLCALVLDYLARQKVGGTNLNFFIVKQLPVLPPNGYTRADVEYIAPRVLELVYTAWDLKPFAEDMGYDGAPFRWDEERRAYLRAELDAYYARLYGLTRDELRYILDPKEVYGEDFPGETFRVLKDKEMKLYGEYRTRRLVLEKWDGLFGKG